MICEVWFLALQDPTDQTGLDNYMVHQLDGTQNEWGWCKQKVYKQKLNIRSHVTIRSVQITNLPGLAFFDSLVQMSSLLCHLQSVKLVLLSRRFHFIRYIHHIEKIYGVQCSLFPVIYSLNLLLPIKPSPNERD